MLPKLKSPTACCKKSPIHNGVIIIPNNPEILALKIAAGIFPLAMDTITTEEDTVDGNAARKRNESHKL
ncbi:hypothetical protein CYCD_03190 [Tenuifilaceae bacterium CYCD]|nr:hypothetical protein CYCD_03190 [Tenuifilaceae bacterium CYCD]